MSEFTLTQEQQDILLETAREALRSTLDGRSPRWPQTISGLEQKRGAFVTIHRRGALRGCIGRMSDDAPLFIQIQEMALAAAFGDPRFPPLTKNELDEIQLEISILSPMIACAPAQVVPGKHGVYLALGGKSGVFLPQVATEQGWDREALLENLCRKAGLAPGSFLVPEARLMYFTAFVFGGRY